MFNPVRPITIPIQKIERSDKCSLRAVSVYDQTRFSTKLPLNNTQAIYVFTLYTKYITLFSKRYN
jgi:hypothetical protein